MILVSPRALVAGADDRSSLDRLLAGPRFRGADGAPKTGEALAIAIWEFLTDPDEGLFHYCAPLDPVTGGYVWDAVLLLNVFGWCVCGIAANTLATLARHAGLPARIVAAKGHLVSEVFYDGEWHLLDADLKAFHRRHPPRQTTIASYADLIADPTLVSAQRHPSSPYYLPDRPPERMAEIYRVTPWIRPPYLDSTRTMDFVLRPGETLERTAMALGKWIWFKDYNDFKTRFPGEWMDDGPQERHGRCRTYCNGTWIYRPDLTDRSLDFAAGCGESRNVATSPQGLVAAAAGSATCSFEFNSPWIFVGTPKRDGTGPSRDGVAVEFEMAWHGAGRAPQLLLATEDGLAPLPLWTCPGQGCHPVRLDITEQLLGRHAYRLSFDLGDAGTACLRSLGVTSSILLSRASLGHLRPGENRIQVRFGDDDGLPACRRVVREIDLSRVASLDGIAWSRDNLVLEPQDPDCIRPLDATRDYALTFRVDAPPHGRLAKVFLHAGYRGKDPADPAESRLHAAWSEHEHGPWQDFIDAEVLPHPDRWHIAAEGEAPLPARPPTVFVRIAGRTGLRVIRIRAHCLDDRGTMAPPPALRISHAWEEAGSLRWHHQDMSHPGHDEDYVLAAGESPVLRRLVMSAGHLAAPHHSGREA